MTDGCVFVPFGGYYVEAGTGHAVCTRCAADGKRVLMLDAGGGYMCNACGTSYRAQET